VTTYTLNKYAKSLISECVELRCSLSFLGVLEGPSGHICRVTCAIDFRAREYIYLAKRAGEVQRIWTEGERDEIGLFLETRALTQVALPAHNNESLPERKAVFKIRPELGAIMENAPITILLSLPHMPECLFTVALSGASETRVIAISNEHGFPTFYYDRYNRTKYKTGR